MSENIQSPKRHGQFSGLLGKAGEVLTYGANMGSAVLGAVNSFVNTIAHNSVSTSKTIWAAAADRIRLQAPQLEVERRRQAELAAERLAAIVESSDDARRTLMA